MKQQERENLINIIARCNHKDTRLKWIEELSLTTDIECSESQCDNCIIAEECIEVNEKITRCTSDCKIDNSKRCFGCNFIGCSYKN